MKTYTGSCHCGAIAFEVDTETPIAEVMECNCSHCERKGLLLVFVPEARLRVVKGAEQLTSYQFGGKSIDHLFCNICGVQPIGRGIAGRAAGMAAVNVRCLKDVDITTLTRKHYNGKDL